ncbi:hypothetical protein [Dermatobacter hominis]|uniref:hypothetical protein n=1 Tax=Dermatobacter hominis TaxID=2884263 RepID=UPI001D0F4EF2|nr:hypothetical protein [Dermatobacter hominis]UDY37349.1 hypothetical protein LH044_07370 [Dermatobacter hominis]
MHPIERLRFVARSQGAPADLLVEESAMALGAFRDDPAGLVAACRRIIDRQLTCGPLWWLCARILCAPEPMAEARAAVEELNDDTTPRRLASALPDDATVVVLGEPEVAVAGLARRGDVQPIVVDVDGSALDVVRRFERVDVLADAVPARSVAVAVDRSDVVLLEALAVGPTAALVPAGSRAAAAVARQVDVPVWLVVGVGRLMPGRMWDALVGRWSASVDPFDAPEEELSLDLVDRVVGPDGLVDVAEALRATDCPVAPELFRLAG